MDDSGEIAKPEIFRIQSENLRVEILGQIEFRRISFAATGLSFAPLVRMNRNGESTRFARVGEPGLPRIDDWRGREHSGSKTMLGRPKHLHSYEEPTVVQRFVAIAADDVARDATNRIRTLAEEKDIDLVTHSLDHIVWVQQRAFSDALYALLDNAVRASRRGYPVMLEAHMTREGDTLWEIQDLGEGMSAQKLAELGHNPAGPGRGVARAWSVVENHHGMLRFESALGVGTTASIWLPAVGGLGFD